MLKHLKENYGNRPSVNESERQELEFLQSEVARLKESMANGPKSTASDKRDDSSDSGSEGEYVDDLPVTMGKKDTVGPRMSVSAEVFGKFNIEKEYKPPVHHKSIEQITAIKERMSSNFMFSSLNPKDKKAIMDAILLVTKKAGEVVIK